MNNEKPTTAAITLALLEDFTAAYRALNELEAVDKFADKHPLIEVNCNKVVELALEKVTYVRDKLAGRLKNSGGAA